MRPAASSTVQTFAVTDTASPIFGASIQIPPGALADDAKITIGMVTDPPDFPNDMTGVGSVVEFGPDGLVFSNTRDDFNPIYRTGSH